jgi:ParB family chromosome partitioning protein
MTSNDFNAAPAAMARIQVRLGDLGLAKEDLRFHEPADEGVPQLAETILAAGVVIRRSSGPAARLRRPSWPSTVAAGVWACCC